MQLVTMIEFGPRVVINCAGFIKIDTSSVRDLDADDVDLLDSTRVHPESYDLAKKMAVDALEYDDTEECDPTVALEEIVHRYIFFTQIVKCLLLWIIVLL